MTEEVKNLEIFDEFNELIENAKVNVTGGWLFLKNSGVDIRIPVCMDSRNICDEDAVTILKMIAESVMAVAETVPDMTEFRQVKDFISLTAVNAKKYGDMLNDVPHRKVLDLALVCRVLTGNGDSIMATTVTNRQLKEWGITEEELMETAIRNSRQNHSVTLSYMDVRSEPYVISNKYGKYGAASGVDTFVLRELASRLDDSLLLFPVSEDKILAVCAGNKTRDDVERIVEKYCCLFDEPEAVQWLSDNVYGYDMDTGELTITSEQKGEE